MAPNVEVAAAETPKFYDDNEIVITGISGRLPNCNTLEEFKEKLFNGTDILAEGENRWPDGKYLVVLIIIVYNYLKN